MNKAQKKAMYDFCRDYGFYGLHDVFMALKEIGAIERNESFSDIARYPKNGTYQAMYDFLADSLG